MSTNIAETSLTIDGVVFVIDPGFAKQKVNIFLKYISILLLNPWVYVNSQGIAQGSFCFVKNLIFYYKIHYIGWTYQVVIRS